MSIKVMSYIWEHSPHKGSELITLLAIADYADDQGIAYPSIAALSKKTRMTERNVDHVLKKLVERHALSIARQAGPYRSNIFTIHFPASKIGHGEKFSPPEDEKFSPPEDEKFSSLTMKPRSKKSKESSTKEPEMVKTFQGMMVKTSAEEMTPDFTLTIIRDPSEEKPKDLTPPLNPPPTEPLAGGKVETMVRMHDPMAASFDQPLKENAKVVLHHLSKVTGMEYQSVVFIEGILSTGATVNDCLLMIDWWDKVWTANRPNQREVFDSATPFKRDIFGKNLPKARKWHAEGRGANTPKRPFPTKAVT